MSSAEQRSAAVLLVNLLTDFRTPLSANILGWHEPYGWGGTLVLPIFRNLIEFQAFTLFSFLFGVGVAISGAASCRAGAGLVPGTAFRRVAGEST
jgi:uncharacterized membrane protein YeiB